METIKETELTEEQIHQQLSTALQRVAVEYSQLENSCIYARRTGDFHGQFGQPMSSSFKVNGSIVLLVEKGEVEIEINTEFCRASAPAIISLNHGAFVHVHSDTVKNAEVYVLIYSPSFLRDVNISFSAISTDAFIDRPLPFLQLREREVPLILRYFSLLHSVMADAQDKQIARHIVSSLTSALFYQLMAMVCSRIEHTHKGQGTLQRNNYVQDFMRLVHIYYNRERSVSFYASKLFISAKYLSILVKEATGRSAAQWIDIFVIMEAKNLLRYSGKNVQQVAYALNFSNQSSFGKYFKHLTGLSPTEYQKQ